MFGRAMYRTADMIEQHNLLNYIADLVDADLITSTMTECLSPICAETIRKAHARVESGTTRGKIVIEGWD